MAEIAFENGRISDFQGLLTLTLYRVILHTVVHHSSTSTYTPNFSEIKETFCGLTDGRTFETHFIRSKLKSRPKNLKRDHLSDVWRLSTWTHNQHTNTRHYLTCRSCGHSHHHYDHNYDKLVS